jgi:hypothetical protein
MHIIKRLKEPLFRICVIAFIIFAVLLFWRALNPGLKIKASPETVAALRVPHRAVGLLEGYAAKHGIPFPELFTLFCAENDFFPIKSAVYDLSVLERQYVMDFHAIKRQYDTKSIEPYVSMFANIFNELVCFPIPYGWEPEGEVSYMYGDNWQLSHQGMDIIDRENIRSRIPVVSMTDGIVQDAGYNDVWGYHAGIVTIHGTYYLYAHLDNLAAGIAPGEPVTAGQNLGRMGDSGHQSRTNRKQNDIPTVHLHIGISPITGFTKNRLWINPYPLLRYIENK